MHNLGVISEHQSRILDGLIFVWREGDQRQFCLASDVGFLCFIHSYIDIIINVCQLSSDGGWGWGALKPGPVFRKIHKCLRIHKNKKFLSMPKNYSFK